MSPDPPAKPRTRRLFLALWPDDALRQQIAIHTGRWAWPPGCAVYAPSDWHLTLHFIGRVPVEQMADIEAGAHLPLDPFACVLDKPQIWPRGLAVLCASQAPRQLVDLHQRLGFVLRDLQHATDLRPFRPHLTLARHADGARAPGAGEAVVWPVRGYALVASTGKTEQRYEVLRHYR